MPRAMWNGVIGFGMVSIPVKLYAATESHNVSFHQLHSVCRTRIKEVRWCATCEREVPWEEVQKGYEYTKGDYVMLDDDDMKKLPIPSKDAIEVSSFCTGGEVDPIFFEKHYYLEPEKNGKRPFELFCRALIERGMMGIASITLRTKERLCVLRPVGAHLVLSTLLYPDELRIDPFESIPEHKVTEQELQMATNLIDLLTEEFEPEKYEDRYRAALLELIDAKLEGQPVKKEKHRVAQGELVDLLEALKNSVSSVKSGAKKALKKTQEGKSENVVPLKNASKRSAQRKTAAKSAARAPKASAIGRIAKTKRKASTKKVIKTRTRSKSKKRSA